VISKAIYWKTRYKKRRNEGKAPTRAGRGDSIRCRYSGEDPNKQSLNTLIKESNNPAAMKASRRT
jgi:hypothetical protein